MYDQFKYCTPQWGPSSMLTESIIQKKNKEEEEKEEEKGNEKEIFKKMLRKEKDLSKGPIEKLLIEFRKRVHLLAIENLGH